VPANDKIEGVNLGGWLVLERWLTPSVFKGSVAQDEFSFSAKMTDKRRRVLDRHRDTFITEKDFEWISKQGLNAVRLPVGYWALESTPPYIETRKYIDKAFKWAAGHNLAVILDLHAAPGSQNGLDHSGRKGEATWHHDQSNIDRTVQILGTLAKEYGKQPNLWGIEVLNEPDPTIPIKTLQEYYLRAIEKVKPHINENVKIIVSDAYRPIAEWDDFLKLPASKNVVLDVHMYQTFGEENMKLSLEQHITKTFKWKRTLEAFGPEKVLVGEWSAALHEIYNRIHGYGRGFAQELYVNAQKYAFSDTSGWCYWTYKTETADTWNYRYLVEPGSY
jgi:glucan 1,3-beta-glucosidase